MVDSAKLLTLIHQLEENEEPDRDLDGDIAEALSGGGLRHTGKGWMMPTHAAQVGDGQWAGYFTKYLGAVRNAMPDETRWRLTADQGVGRCEAHVYYNETEFAHAAAARECNALLRAFLSAEIEKAKAADRA